MIIVLICGFWALDDWFTGDSECLYYLMLGSSGHHPSKHGVLKNNSAASRYVFHVLIEVAASFQHVFRMSSSGKSSWLGDLAFYRFLGLAFKLIVRMLMILRSDAHFD